MQNLCERENPKEQIRDPDWRETERDTGREIERKREMGGEREKAWQGGFCTLALAWLGGRGGLKPLTSWG